MNAAAYLRVSTQQQDVATQRAAVERLALARGDVVTEWYAEKFTGGTMDRPELARLRADARAGKVARLYVYRLDRLTRTGISDTLRLVEEFRSHGADLVSCSDGFDLQGPAAEICLAVMAWAAKMERLANDERRAAARARLEAEGRSWGRPTRLTQGDREAIESLHRLGRSIRRISMALGIPRATVARAVSKVTPLPAP